MSAIGSSRLGTAVIIASLLCGWASPARSAVITHDLKLPHTAAATLTGNAFTVPSVGGGNVSVQNAVGQSQLHAGAFGFVADPIGRVTLTGGGTLDPLPFSLASLNTPLPGTGTFTSIVAGVPSVSP